MLVIGLIVACALAGALNVPGLYAVPLAAAGLLMIANPIRVPRVGQLETSTVGTPEEAFTLLNSYPRDKMRMVQSGLEKRDRLGF